MMLFGGFEIFVKEDITGPSRGSAARAAVRTRTGSKRAQAGR
jgi:hypothetical protein